MQIFTSMIGTDKGGLVKCDTIKHDGGLWIVPQWLVSPDEAVQRPAYIIRIDTLPLQETPGGKFGDYILSQGNIPIDVLEGRTTGKFEVIRNPDISTPVGRA